MQIRIKNTSRERELIALPSKIAAYFDELLHKMLTECLQLEFLMFICCFRQGRVMADLPKVVDLSHSQL